MARILIAEDNAHQLRVLSMWLARNGHEAIETRNGKEAQSVLSGTTESPGQPERRPETPDLIITDANMPEVDGIELVQWVRTKRRLDVPILMLSSRCDQESLTEQLGGLNVRVLPKPFSPTRLVAEIEQILARAVPDAVGARTH